MNGFIKTFLVIAITLVTSFTYAFASLPDGLEVSISMEKNQFKSTEPVLINTTFVNTSLNDIKFLKWNTPLENGFKTDLFRIQDTQLNLIKYTGKLLKRATPNDEDYITLAAGESITSTLNLSSAYDLKNEGDYTVKYTNSTDNHSLRFYLLDNRDKPAPYNETLQKVTSQSACSAEQSTILESVLPEASKLVAISASLLKEISENNHPIAERYTQWFGIYDSDNYQKVLTGFEAISKSFESETIVFNCNCNENAIAYVYPDRPYEINICPSFWDLNLKGTDSQTGTIIHELTHFKTTISADDYVYGKKKSLALAVSFPEKAIMNADNYEYFSENNNPYLAMYSPTIADSHEPDNSKVTAKLLTQDAPQVHTIHTKTDADWLKFEVTSDSYVNIHTIGPYKGDTEIRLYNEAGEEISFGDDIDSTINNNYSEIGIDGLKKGNYFIKVNGYKSSAIVTEYKITLTILPQGSGKTFENESNNNATNSTSSSGSILWPTLIMLFLFGVLRRSTRP